MVSWHIEPTSKCILECPLCDRTWFYEKFKKRELHEIDVEHLARFLGNDSTVTMCGNNGDPIYHRDFIKLCSVLKKQNTTIAIHTNGSGKNKEWWENLTTQLGPKDSITFAVDGLADTNHIYRKNAKWDTIMTAMKVCVSSSVKVIWKFIVFKQNQHQIEVARKLSKKIGIDYFMLEKSDRWWDKSDLMPDQKYVDHRHEYKSTVVKGKNVKGTITPNCMVKNKPEYELYIDSAGNFYPCCWQGLYGFRHKDIFDPRLENFNIKNTTAEEILEHPKVKEFFDKIYDYEKVNKCCKIYCGATNG
tara:strand:+ start:240 stop:1148 length:909 start_codon:yes stop_codon:yes gene_type:complete